MKADRTGCVCTDMCISMRMDIYIYIYIYIERERDRERETYTYIYIYTHAYVYTCIFEIMKADCTCPPGQVLGKPVQVSLL